MSLHDASVYDPDQPEMPTCPKCGREMAPAHHVLQGEVLWCARCGAELEVVSVEPLRLELCEDESAD